MDQPTHLEYESVGPQKGHGFKLIHLLVTIGIIALLISILLPTTSRRPPTALIFQCASNLRQIGQAITLYARDNYGISPPDLQTLAAAEPFWLYLMVCPSSGDRKPANARAIGVAGGCSYIYVGPDLAPKSDPNCIVALEDPADHGLEGSNVLFADGHVDWLDLREVQFLLNALDTGRNPPVPYTPNLTRAAAEQDYQKNWKTRMPQLKTGVWRIPATQPASSPE